ncbi:MAG: dihydrolipoamide acetyltransferase family protein [Anaerolineales bacterium]
MAEVINMPKLGFDMAEGSLVRWVVQEGDPVEEGEVLAEIETDKATVEVESAASGTVLKHLVLEGTSLPVGDPLAVIGEPDEEVDFDALVGSAAAGEAEEEPAAEPETASKPTAEGAKPTAEGAKPTAPPQPETAQPTSAPAAGDGHLPGGIKASPLARRIAEDQEINLQGLQGSGPGGRIVKKDVEAALGQEPAAAGGSFTLSGAPRQTERIPVSKLRAAVGRRMTSAKQNLPHFYVTADIDAGPMMEVRRQANEMLPQDEKLSVNDFIVKAAAFALREFPNLNASLEGDTIVRHGPINIGVAVAVEGGLMTVVVRDADRKPLRLISQETKAMAARARQGKVRTDDVEGSTFTVSNLGMFDVDHFVAIINPPEAAILATGSVRKVPVVQGDQVTTGRRMKATISADHRVTDGAEAARWLQLFRQMLESPLRLVL